jgi:hypothetical protein
LSDEHKEILVHWFLKIFFQRLFFLLLTSCIWLYLKVWKNTRREVELCFERLFFFPKNKVFCSG